MGSGTIGARMGTIIPPGMERLIRAKFVINPRKVPWKYPNGGHIAKHRSWVLLGNRVWKEVGPGVSERILGIERGFLNVMSHWDRFVKITKGGNIDGLKYRCDAMFRMERIPLKKYRYREDILKILRGLWGSGKHDFEASNQLCVKAEESFIRYISEILDEFNKGLPEYEVELHYSG